MSSARKVSALLLAVMLTVALAACGGAPAEKKEPAVYVPGEYSQRVFGFESMLTVTVTVDEYSIVSVTAEGNETPEYGAKALEELPAAFVEAGSADVDGVSGATETSNAVKQAVAAALDEARVA